MTANFSLIYGLRGPERDAQLAAMTETQRAEFDRMMRDLEQRVADIHLDHAGLERAMQQAMQPMDEAMRRIHSALFDPSNNPMTQATHSDIFQIEHTYKEVPKAETPAVEKKAEKDPQPDRFDRILKDDD